MKARYDVAVSGAGVAGLTLAAALTRQGLEVLLLDKRATPPPVHKGEVLQPRSLEVLDAVGALPVLRRRGALSASRLVCRHPDGREIGALDYSLLPGPYDHLVLHYYTVIGEALAQSCRGVDLRRGATVTAPLVDRGGRVTGVQVRAGGTTTDVAAALTVSCEGGGSRLARALGCGVQIGHYRHRLLAFDLAAIAPVSEVCAYLTPRGLRLLYPMPGGRARLYVQVGPAEYRSIGRAGLPAWAHEVVAGVPALRPVEAALVASLATVQPLGATRYIAGRWWREGFALAGDAAHGVHPMAAQGMNAAIADAWELAGQLSRAGSLAPQAVDAAVAAYAAVRAERMAYTARLSHNLASVFTDTRWHTRAAARVMLARNATNRRLQSMITYNMSGLGVQRFSRRDRLHQFGLPDPGRAQPFWTTARPPSAAR